MIKQSIAVINYSLSLMFPYKEPRYKGVPFIDRTWLEKIMDPLQIKDYLWYNK